MSIYALTWLALVGTLVVGLGFGVVLGWLQHEYRRRIGR